MFISISDNILNLRYTQKEDMNYIIEAEKEASKDGFVDLWSEKKHLETLNGKDSLHLIVEETDTKLKVGYLIINGLNDGNNNLELMRLVITKKHNGYGKKTIDLVKKIAFELLDFNRLWLDVRIHNNYALEMYKDMNFIQEGILRNCFKFNENYISIVIMSILKFEYFKNNDKL